MSAIALRVSLINSRIAQTNKHLNNPHEKKSYQP